MTTHRVQVPTARCLARLALGLACLSMLFTSNASAHDTLFVGNSFTFSNQPNGVVGVHTGLQEAQGGFANVTHEDLSKASYTLDLHAKDADGTKGDTALRDRLVTGDPSANPWRYVILQEQSQTAGFHATDDPFGPGPLWDISLDAALVLNSLVSARGADTVFMMTWGYRQGDTTMHTELFPDFLTMQARLTEGYEMYATELSTVMRTVYLAPAGLAFQLVYEDLVASGEDPMAADSAFSALYSGDGRHPSIEGSYLAGCVTYATLTGRDPQRLVWAPSSIGEARRELLQAAAAAVTVADPYSPRVLPWGDAFRYPFLAPWSDLVTTGSGAASLSSSDERPTAVVDQIAAPVESLVMGDLPGQAGRAGVLAGGRLTVGADLVLGQAGDGQLDILAGETLAGAVRLAVEEGSYGALHLSGGVLETDAVSAGQGEAVFTMTGGGLYARELDIALHIQKGTWVVSGPGVARRSLHVDTSGIVAVQLPENMASGVALQSDEVATLSGTVYVSPPADGPVFSGTYTLIQGGQLSIDGLTVDASALGDVETSWELSDAQGGAHALLLTVTGGAPPVEAETDAATHSDVSEVDTAAPGPSLDATSPSPPESPEPGASTPAGDSGDTAGGCASGGPIRWGWLGAMLCLCGVLRRRQARRPRRYVWAESRP